MLPQGFPNEREIALNIISPRYQPGTVKINPSALRLQTELINGTNTYTFNPNTNQKLTRPEKGLGVNDHFFAHSLGLFLLYEEATKKGSGDLMTYELNEGQGAVYNGTTSVQINQVKFIDELDNRRFRKVPESQGAYDTSTREYNQASYEDGLVQLPEILIFKGDLNNEISVTIPTWSGQDMAAGLGTTRKCYLVMLASGLYVSGAVGKELTK
ncbi:MAG: hypothetical protein EBS53_05700 [Bacteroidetes bacterium]|nr:hypothetical protein [Bacteroidota bacterium]